MVYHVYHVKPFFSISCAITCRKYFQYNFKVSLMLVS